MAQIFAASFDEATPSANWTTFSVSIVAGRRSNGAATGTLRKTLSSLYPTLMQGIAWKPSGYGGHLQLYNPTVHEGCQISLENTGDGRLYVAFSALGDENAAPIPLALNGGDYFYIEFGSTVTGTVALGVLTIVATWEVRVNDVSLATGTFTHSAATARGVGLQADIMFSTVEITTTGVVDDYYLDDSAFVGDSTVSSTDVVTQVAPIALLMCQEGLEVAEQPAETTRLCQEGLEVAERIADFVRLCQIGLEIVFIAGRNNYVFMKRGKGGAVGNYVAT